MVEVIKSTTHTLYIKHCNRCYGDLKDESDPKLTVERVRYK